MEKLFYKDTRIVEFEGCVEECKKDAHKDIYWVVLDKTAFFPEEGGQAADKGTLAGANVIDVKILNGIIYHGVAEAMETGSCIKGLVDWEQRFDFMQQHSGEHILSGLVNRQYGYINVGFHLGASEVTLDFNGSLSWDELRRLEQQANEVIWKNIPVKAWFPPSDELAAMTYRSKLELSEDVRIVEIPGVDVCACCAPHVTSTGQIGMLKVTNVQSHRGGIRINILCGRRAYADYSLRQDSVSAISVLLSARQEAVSDAVLRLKEENLRQKEHNNQLQAQLLAFNMASLPSPETARNVILFTDPLDSIAIRSAVNELCEKYQGYCAIMSGDDTAGYQFVIGSIKEDCRELSGRLRKTFHAKGGGSAPMIQGSVSADRTALLDFWNVLT